MLPPDERLQNFDKILGEGTVTDPNPNNDRDRNPDHNPDPKPHPLHHPDRNPNPTLIQP